MTSLHLVPILQNPSPKLALGSEVDRSKYTEHLSNLVKVFCRCLEFVDESSMGDNGRPLPLSMLIQRRNMELLAVIALNMACQKTLDRDFEQVWKRIQDVRCKLTKDNIDI